MKKEEIKRGNFIRIISDEVVIKISKSSWPNKYNVLIESALEENTIFQFLTKEEVINDYGLNEAYLNELNNKTIDLPIEIRKKESGEIVEVIEREVTVPMNRLVVTIPDSAPKAAFAQVSKTLKQSFEKDGDSFIIVAEGIEMKFEFYKINGE